MQRECYKGKHQIQDVSSTESRASQVVLVIKNLPANAGDMRDVGSVLWRRAQQPTPVFLPGESHGQRSLAGYGP